MIKLDKIKKRQRSSIFGKYNYFLPEIDSTNDYAKRLALGGAPEGTVVLTDFQKEGKGRLNHRWESSKDVNILMSLILRPRLNIDHVLRLTLASAVIIIKALKKSVRHASIKPIDFTVKWPNDIMVNEKKIGGVLLESSLREKEVLFVVIGIGLNINQDLSILNKDIRKSATSLYAETGRIFERERIIADILTIFERDYFKMERTNYSGVIREWKSYCTHLGKEIKIESHAGEAKGRFLDINQKGILIYRTESGEEKELITGSVKHIGAGHGVND
jgi:BirA family biotin operon repressor/biotin-[acetyl-CoA-carboxylase] ligase